MEEQVEEASDSEEMSTASMSVKTAELLKCSETEFDKTIQEMSLKDLLEAISSLQKEMTKEQENFNSLGTELGALNKNSQQYKQISKEMTQSQSKLTVLMNRSMKCFQQQGNQQSKQKSGNNQVQRRNSARNTTQNSESGSNSVQRRHSAKIKAEDADTVNIAIDKQTAKSNPTIDTAGQNKPVVLKPLTTVDVSKLNMKKNESNNPKHTSSISVNSSSNSSSTTQNGETSNRSAFKVQPKTTRGKILALGRMEPQNSVTVIKTESTSGSGSVTQNGVTEHEQTSKVSSVVNVTNQVNGSKYTSSTSKKSNQNENGNNSDMTVMPLKVNGSAMQKPPRKLIKSSIEQPSGENLLEQIRNFRRNSNDEDSSPPDTEKAVKDTNVFRAKPIVIKPVKTENTEIKTVQRNSQEQKPPLIFHAGRPVVLDANVEQERRNMLDQIKAHKKSDTQHEQLAELEKEKKPYQLNTDNHEANISGSQPDKELQTDKKVSASGVGKVSMATISLQRNSREIKDFVQPKQTISVNILKNLKTFKLRLKMYRMIQN
ncbi:hypothetical protein KUTeg_020642 [Tegillarca granosa]|uniref:Uncharacterized protein n=1 Tax=Tegillarca granosa TaxID=220873 RepID=A0ABQ9E900_TEGGR|nr:hypothetical protein KUTeg_020642 [Tegillarca granosa]